MMEDIKYNSVCLAYAVKIFYFRKDLEEKPISVLVNGDPALMVQANTRSGISVTVPISLHTGDNSIRLGYSGTSGFDLDKIELLRDSAE